MTVEARGLPAQPAAQAEYRAGGTDLQQRLRRGVSLGPPLDLPPLPAMREIRFEDGGAVRIGALTTVAAIAADARLSAAYPALARAAAGLATPQIRAVATLGGNLLQRNRCWYFRDPAIHCLKKGGSRCHAREGNHLYHACFDLGPCIAVHPSTLGMALLTYDAAIETADGAKRGIAALYGDGSDPGRDHQLPAREVLTSVVMPPALAGERAAYFRATSRALAEWPLVEAAVRLQLEQGIVTYARVAVGGVAPIPLRVEAVEAALLNRPPSAALFMQAALLAARDARPLPQTRYKLRLIPATVATALERAIGPPP